MLLPSKASGYLLSHYTASKFKVINNIDGGQGAGEQMQTRKIKPIMATLFPCAHTLARAPLSGPAWQCPQP